MLCLANVPNAHEKFGETRKAGLLKSTMASTKDTYAMILGPNHRVLLHIPVVENDHKVHL